MNARLSFRSLMEWVAIVGIVAGVVAETSRERFWLAFLAPIVTVFAFRWISHPTALAVCRLSAWGIAAAATGFVTIFLGASYQVVRHVDFSLIWPLGIAVIALALVLWLSMGVAVGYALFHEWWDFRPVDDC